MSPEFAGMDRKARLKLAVAEWEQKTGSLRQLARKYGLNSSGIHHTHTANKQRAIQELENEPKAFLRREEREELLNYLGQLHKFGLKLDKDDFQRFVLEKLHGREPSRNWFYEFQSEFRKQFEVAKEEAEGMVDHVLRVETLIKAFHQNLMVRCNGIPEENILCYDEVSFTDNLRKGYNLIE